MPFDNQEKLELQAAAELAIDLDEPEAFIEALRRVAARKGDRESLSDQERARWRLVARSLQTAVQTLASDKQEQEGATAASQAPATEQATSTDN